MTALIPFFLAVVFLFSALLSMPASSWGHGFAGNRFFPTTLAVEDPSVADELSFLFNHINEPDQETNEISFELAKRITENFGIEIGDAYRFINPHEARSRDGFGNLEVGAKYQFFTNGPHETILSVGVSAEIGGTGARSVDADSFSTISPTLFFGKGLGDLPDEVWYLKPLAITGSIGPNFPTRARNELSTVDPATGTIEREVEKNPITLDWGLTLQYNLQYLQTYVKDVCLGAPFNRMVMLVEFPFETCLDRGCEGQTTTGFVNPGLIWFGKSFQLGVEAQIPVNGETAKDVGVLALVHFFIDDLFPNSLGRPIFK